MIGKWLTPEGAWFFFIVVYFVFYATAGVILVILASSRRAAGVYLLGAWLPLGAAVAGWWTGAPPELFGAGIPASLLLVALGAWGLMRTRHGAH